MLGAGRGAGCSIEIRMNAGDLGDPSKHVAVGLPESRDGEREVSGTGRLEILGNGGHKVAGNWVRMQRVGMVLDDALSVGNIERR